MAYATDLPVQNKVAATHPRGGAFALALALYGFVICWTAFSAIPAPPLPANASVTEFSGERAMNLLRTIDGDGLPHPVGSAEDAVIRERIIAQLKSLGYAPRVQESFACGEAGVCAEVRNVIAKLDGRESGLAVLVAAHYDSVAAGPGASDDGAGVVSVLEIARALKSSPPLQHSVVFLLDEGEEAGLLGAEAFVEHDAEAPQIRAAVNMDNRGTSGRAVMFETGAANEWALRLYARTGLRSNANSLTYTVYKLLPNDTDFTVFKRAGYQGLNFAFIGDVTHYHTTLDDVAHASAASIQSEGESGLAAVRALANSDLKPRKPSEAVYFSAFGKLIWWAAKWALGFAVLALVLLLIEVVTLGRRKRVNGRAFASGILSWIVTLIVSAGGGAALFFLLRAIHALPANWVAYPAPSLAASWGLGFAIVTWLALAFWRGAGFWGLWSGIWIWWAIAAIASAALLPGVSYVFVFPALAAGIFGLPLLFESGGESSSHKIAGLIAAVVPAFAAAVAGIEVVWTLYIAMGAVALPAITLLVALIVTPLAPLVAGTSGRWRWRFPAIASAVTIAGIIAAPLVPAFTRSSPQSLDIEYLQNMDAEKPQWLVFADSGRLPASFSRAGNFKRSAAPVFPWSSTKPFSADAPALHLPAPEITLRQSASSDGANAYSVLLKSPRGAPAIRIAFPPGSGVRDVSLAGAAVPEISPRFLRYTHGWKIFGTDDLPSGGAEMQFTISNAKPVGVLLWDTSYSLPPEGLLLREARAANAVPIQNGDSSIVIRRLTLTPAPPPSK